MKKSLIIGAGQLGSRHLQGLLKQNISQSIYVVDPSEISLELSKKRALEIEHTHQITWCTSISQLPTNIDLAIVATSANVRKNVVEQLLNHSTIEFLVLEKVLFQKLDEYDSILNLLNQKKQSTWVNHPRRMFSCYEYFKKEIDQSHGTLSMKVEGNNWGLACNGLHVLDLFQFLTGHSVVEIQNEWVDKNCFQSKRSGFIEFYGTIKAVTNHHDTCVITSSEGEPSPLKLSISKGEKHWTIQEGSTIEIISSDGLSNSFAMQYQSELSCTLATKLFEEKKCALPTYSESDILHRLFIQSFLEVYNNGLEVKTDLLPIT
ncbi:MAG: hypothetical protein RL204_319 [Bacteroidota bacterium]|jgi:predicted dehydrogenase